MLLTRETIEGTVAGCAVCSELETSQLGRGKVALVAMNQSLDLNVGSTVLVIYVFLSKCLLVLCDSRCRLEKFLQFHFAFV